MNTNDDTDATTVTGMNTNNVMRRSFDLETQLDEWEGLVDDEEGEWPNSLFLIEVAINARRDPQRSGKISRRVIANDTRGTVRIICLTVIFSNDGSQIQLNCVCLFHPMKFYIHSL